MIDHGVAARSVKKTHTHTKKTILLGHMRSVAGSVKKKGGLCFSKWGERYVESKPHTHTHGTPHAASPRKQKHRKKDTCLVSLVSGARKNVVVVKDKLPQSSNVPFFDPRVLRCCQRPLHIETFGKRERAMVTLSISRKKDSHSFGGKTTIFLCVRVCKNGDGLPKTTTTATTLRQTNQTESTV